MKEHRATFSFKHELNDFLSTAQRQQDLKYHFNGHPGIKDPIEAQGIPHTEVELILVNGKSVAFNYQLQPDDHVTVYPTINHDFTQNQVTLREQFTGQTAFILDVHLGKLARLLRLLGFDTVYRNDYNDREIIRIALDQNRILLTRDRRMLYNRCITHGQWLHSTDPLKQAGEVIRRFDLSNKIKRFTRCPSCNGHIQEVKKELILDQLETLTKKFYSEFFQCSACKKVYWRGSHYKHILATLNTIQTESRRGQ